MHKVTGPHPPAIRSSVIRAIRLPPFHLMNLVKLETKSDPGVAKVITKSFQEPFHEFPTHLRTCLPSTRESHQFIESCILTKLILNLVMGIGDDVRKGIHVDSVKLKRNERLGSANYSRTPPKDFILARIPSLLLSYSPTLFGRKKLTRNFFSTLIPLHPANILYPTRFGRRNPHTITKAE